MPKIAKKVVQHPELKRNLEGIRMVFPDYVKTGALKSAVLAAVKSVYEPRGYELTETVRAKGEERYLLEKKRLRGKYESVEVGVGFSPRLVRGPPGEVDYRRHKQGYSNKVVLFPPCNDEYSTRFVHEVYRQVRKNPDAVLPFHEYMPEPGGWGEAWEAMKALPGILFSRSTWKMKKAPHRHKGVESQIIIVWIVAAFLSAALAILLNL